MGAWTLLRDWHFLPLSQPPLFFTTRSYKAYLPGTGTLGYAVGPGAGIARSPGNTPNFYSSHVNVGLPSLLLLHATPLDPHLSSPLPLSTSPHLLPVWMNVASLNPWLLDFHIA